MSRTLRWTSRKWVQEDCGLRRCDPDWSGAERGSQRRAIPKAWHPALRRSSRPCNTAPQRARFVLAAAAARLCASSAPPRTSAPPSLHPDRRIRFAHDSPAGGRWIRTSGSARDKASVPRFRFGPPSLMSADGSRRQSGDGGMQPKRRLSR